MATIPAPWPFRLDSSPCVHFHYITLPASAPLLFEPQLSCRGGCDRYPRPHFQVIMGSHTRLVSFNYLNCITAECTGCAGPSPTKVRVPHLKLRHSKWTGTEPGRMGLEILRFPPRSSLESKGKKGVIERQIRSDSLTINPDVELIITWVYSVCSW